METWTVGHCDEVCTEDEKSWLPRWDTFVKVNELKGIDKRISRVFGNKKPQIIAGSFFAVGGSWVRVAQSIAYGRGGGEGGRWG